MIAIFITAFFIYGTQAYFVYSKLLTGPWYYLTGAVTAVLGSFCWLRIAALSANPHSVMMNGLIYDLILMSAYIVTPIVMSRMTHVSPLFWVGLVFTIGGIVTMKLSEIS